MKRLLLFAFRLSTCCLLQARVVASRLNPAELGPFAQWAKIEIQLAGPDLAGGGDPNPFGIEVDGVFPGPGGKVVTVPGFYDGDGRGGLDGNVWKVPFPADEVGEWLFRSRYENRSLHDQTASFTVVQAIRPMTITTPIHTIRLNTFTPVDDSTQSPSQSRTPPGPSSTNS
ncbi:DUF5060 domain-containing protein [Lignipirellula cremea]|uniref:DUF5060 domain-containing protein n=1 Tax=Lignipirellula cremea TaxID=2528010 RepID=A0A518DL86_9BACT|nr:DUF5060 domain-containing protein [Lignipirellula cremea]QDU92602.1 hypothetical protein Pla8534_03500 [Lignipirellula cremea]